MLFEIKAKLAEVKDVTSGTSSRGAWTKATAVLERTEGAYTDTYPMLVFGDKIQEAEALVGKEVNAKFNIQARTYNGRYYIDLRLQFVSAAQADAPKAQPAPAPEKEDDPNADLPF